MNESELPPALLDEIGPVQGLTGSPQGMTSTLAIAETASGRVAIKRAEGALYSGWLAREHAVLSALAATTLPMPRPLAFVRDDTGLVPVAWLAMSCLPGRPLAEAPAVEQSQDRRVKVLRAYGRTLRDIHSAAAPAAIVRHSHGWLDYMLEEASENLEHFNVDGTPQLLASLRQARPSPVMETLIHGDFTIDNVLTDGDAITGVIDWSGGAVGDPRYDLALAIRPHHGFFEKQRAQDLHAFFDGYGGDLLSQADFEYFNGLYEFF